MVVEIVKLHTLYGSPCEFRADNQCIVIVNSYLIGSNIYSVPSIIYTTCALYVILGIEFNSK